MSEQKRAETSAENLDHDDSDDKIELSNGEVDLSINKLQIDKLDGNEDSQNGCVSAKPFVSSSDWNQLLQTFPTEIWEMQDTYEAMSRKRKRNGNEASPWFSGILNLRLVCRRWNQAIDKYLQTAPLAMKKPVNFTQEVFSEGYNLNKRAQRILDHFRESHNGLATVDRSPFVGRSVVFLVQEMMPDQFMNPMISLLRKYGHHIFQCKICIFGNFEVTSASYLKLKTLWDLMPNLKTFAISALYKISNTTASSRQNQEFESTIKCNPLRLQRQLECLNVGTGIHPSILHRMIGSTRNLKMLNGQYFVYESQNVSYVRI